MLHTKLLATGIAFIVYTAASAQQSGYSDIGISAISFNAAGPLKKVPAVGNNASPINHAPVIITASDELLKCSITVSNASNANAYGAKLIVVLPAEVTVPAGGLPSNATLVNERGITASPGYIQFDLLIIYPNRDVTAEFTFYKSKNANKLSAFVFSSVPDANPANNFKDATY
jgi:hypothetical protein